MGGPRPRPTPLVANRRRAWTTHGMMGAARCRWSRHAWRLASRAPHATTHVSGPAALWDGSARPVMRALRRRTRQVLAGTRPSGRRRAVFQPTEGNGLHRPQGGFVDNALVTPVVPRVGEGTRRRMTGGALPLGAKTPV